MADYEQARNAARRVVETCELCSIPWKEHPRCSMCSIGLGEGHVEGPGVLLGNDQPYCGDCAQRRLKQQPIRELAA